MSGRPSRQAALTTEPIPSDRFFAGALKRKERNAKGLLQPVCGNGNGPFVLFYPTGPAGSYLTKAGRQKGAAGLAVRPKGRSIG